jgi:hypothetical protein
MHDFGFCCVVNEISSLLRVYVSDVSGQLIGQIFKDQSDLTLKMGWISCPETSVKNYQYTLSKIPEQSKSQIKYFVILPVLKKCFLPSSNTEFCSRRLINKWGLLCG